MTIYEAIKARLDAGEKEVPVISLRYGKGVVCVLYRLNVCYPLPVEFGGEIGTKVFTKEGKEYYFDDNIQITIGRKKSRKAAKKQIKKQNYDKETQK